MNKKIIVARCNEDVSWAQNIDFADVVIYNKGSDEIAGSIPLPNVGRESGTYLRFIIDNYDDISPSTLYFFLQGNPFDHGVGVEQLEDTIGPCELGGQRWVEPLTGVSNEYFPAGIPLSEFCEMIFVDNPFKNEDWYKAWRDEGISVGCFSITGASIFCAYGIKIKSRCKEFYKFLNMYAQSLNPLEGHIMERIWKYILYTDIKDKITEYSKKRKVFAKNASWNGMKID